MAFQREKRNGYELGNDNQGNVRTTRVLDSMLAQGGHSLRHGGARFAETLRWLWPD